MSFRKPGTPRKRTTNKRQLELTPSKPSAAEKLIRYGRSPQKPLTVQDLSTRLNELFAVRLGSTLTREVVVSTIDDHRVTAQNLGRAMVAAFGTSVGRHRNVLAGIDEYRNLAVKEPKREEFIDPTQHGGAIPKREPTAISAASYVSDVEPFSESGEDTDEPQKTMVTMSVSVEEAELLHSIRQRQLTKKLKSTMQSCLGPLYQTLAVDIVCDIVKQEIKSYASRQNSELRKTSGKEVFEFSYTNVMDEFHYLCPVISEVFESVCFRDDADTRAHRTVENLMPALTNVIATSFSIYSQHLSASRLVNSLLLSEGGAKESCVNRFAQLSLAYSYTQSLNKLDEMAKQQTDQVKNWSANDERYSLVWDNVDKHIRTRHGGDNKMVHMIQTIAVKDRAVFRSSNPPRVRLREVTADNLLPTQDDYVSLVEDLLCLVQEIWAEHIPALKFMAPTVDPFTVHKHSAESKQKSDTANLGVLLKSENDMGDIQDILNFCHGFVPKADDGSMRHVPFVGDQLSFSRSKTAQEARSDGLTAESRGEGLIPTLAEFHISMELLKIIFDLSYSTDSSADIGTLYHARNYLGLSNVSAQAHKRYYYASELVDKTVTALIVKAGMESYSLDAQDSQPDGLPTSPHHTGRVLTDFAQKFIRISRPSASNSEGIRCELCNEPQKSLYLLKRHSKSKHKKGSKPIPQHTDGIADYSALVITLGLLRMYHNKAVSYGDGERLIRLHKFLFILCKSLKLKNYSVGLLEIVLQTLVLPQDLADSIVWNRTVNNKGKKNKNIALDLQLEHENLYFKSELKTYRGEYTQKHVDRISKGRAARKEVIDQLDADTGFRKPSGRHSESDDKHVEMLVKKLVDDEEDQLVSVLQERVRRQHAGTGAVPTEVIDTIPYNDLVSWVNQKIDVLKSKRLYKQFDV